MFFWFFRGILQLHVTGFLEHLMTKWSPKLPESNPDIWKPMGIQTLSMLFYIFGNVCLLSFLLSLMENCWYKIQIFVLKDKVNNGQLVFKNHFHNG